MRIIIEPYRVIVDPEGVTGGPIIGRTTDGRYEWVAATESPGRPFVDWQHPPGGVVEYEHAGNIVQSGLFHNNRRDDMCSLDGRISVRVRRRSGRSQLVTRDQAEFRAKGASRPFVVRGGPNAHSEPFSFQAGAHESRIVEALLDEPCLVIRHNIEMCPVVGCSIPPARLFAVRTADVLFLGEDERGEVQSWALTGVEPRVPAHPVPAVTWSDVRAGYATWADVKAVGSWADVRDGV